MCGARFGPVTPTLDMRRWGAGRSSEVRIPALERNSAHALPLSTETVETSEDVHEIIAYRPHAHAYLTCNVCLSRRKMFVSELRELALGNITEGPGLS